MASFYANLVLGRLLRNETFVRGLSSSLPTLEASFLLILGSWLDIQECFTHFIMTLSGTRKCLLSVSKAGLEPGARG